MANPRGSSQSSLLEYETRVLACMDQMRNDMEELAKEIRKRREAYERDSREIEAAQQSELASFELKKSIGVPKRCTRCMGICNNRAKGNTTASSAFPDIAVGLELIRRRADDEVERPLMTSTPINKNTPIIPSKKDEYAHYNSTQINRPTNPVDFPENCYPFPCPYCDLNIKVCLSGLQSRSTDLEVNSRGSGSGSSNSGDSTLYENHYKVELEDYSGHFDATLQNTQDNSQYTAAYGNSSQSSGSSRISDCSDEEAKADGRPSLMTNYVKQIARPLHTFLKGTKLKATLSSAPDSSSLKAHKKRFSKEDKVDLHTRLGNVFRGKPSSDLKKSPRSLSVPSKTFIQKYNFGVQQPETKTAQSQSRNLSWSTSKKNISKQGHSAIDSESEKSYTSGDTEPFSLQSDSMEEDFNNNFGIKTTTELLPIYSNNNTVDPVLDFESCQLAWERLNGSISINKSISRTQKQTDSPNRAVVSENKKKDHCTFRWKDIKNLNFST